MSAPQVSQPPQPPDARRGAASSSLPLLQDRFRQQQAGRWLVAGTTARERTALLSRLYAAVRAGRGGLAAALARDLGKSRAEAEISELRPVLDELRHTIRHLRGWMRPVRVPTPPNLAGTRSEIQHQALGTTLIVSPWNYPVYLSLTPLVGALAAGNTVILRPSEKAPHTSRALAALLGGVFPPGLVWVAEGPLEVSRALLELPFEHFFYTGGARVGRLVAEAAARFGARVTLELGGKSPAIVERDADLRLTAERLAFAKYLNAGQTCVAPDYVLAHESVSAPLTAELDAAITRLFGGRAWQRRGPDYSRMLDGDGVRRLERLTGESVAAGARVAVGGDFDAAARFVSPTVVSGVTADMPLMQEELFGPVLPVLEYRELGEAVAHVRAHDKPLALYLFTGSEASIRRVERETSSGGLVVNGALLHLSNPHLPFGGVGGSGTGAYHGAHSFRTFSHARAVLREGPVDPVPLIHPPYDRLPQRLTAWALRMLGS